MLECKGIGYSLEEALVEQSDPDSEMAIPGDLPSPREHPTGNRNEHVDRMNTLHQSINLEGDRSDMAKLANKIETDCDKDVPEASHSSLKHARYVGNTAVNIPDVKHPGIGLESNLEEMIKLVNGEDTGLLKNQCRSLTSAYGHAHNSLDIYSSDPESET